jgi:hypothetical protein
MFARFAESGQQWLVIAGFITLLVLSIQRRSIDGLTLVLWAGLPLGAISFGTSKIYHYSYPFLPPLALGIGYLIALLIMVVPTPFRRALQGLQMRLGRSRRLGATLQARPVRAVLVTVAAVALAVAATTIVFGPINLQWAGRPVFKSSGLFRPMVIAILFGLLGGAVDAGSRATAVVLVSTLLPLAGYRDSWSRIAVEKHPIRQALECVLDVERRVAGPGLYVDISPDDLPHGIYYHFRRVRPWLRAPAPAPAALGPYLDDPSQQRPILVLDATYQAFMHADAAEPGLRARVASPPLTSFPPSVVLLLPGPYAMCAADQPRESLEH